MNLTGAGQGPQAKAVSADLLVAETHDDLEVPLGLVQREPGEDLGRGGTINSGLHRCVSVFGICHRLLQMANLVCAD